MKNLRKSRSGKVFFLAAVGLVFAAILATVLLANNHRNLDLLLAYLGYPDLLPEPEPPPREVEITQSKAIRLPPGRMVLPVHAFADLRVPHQQFFRLGVMTPTDPSFDRQNWFPLARAGTLPKVRGMVAGDGEGLPLPAPKAAEEQPGPKIETKITSAPD